MFIKKHHGDITYSSDIGGNLLDYLYSLEWVTEEDLNEYANYESEIARLENSLKILKERRLDFVNELIKTPKEKKAALRRENAWRKEMIKESRRRCKLANKDKKNKIGIDKILDTDEFHPIDYNRSKEIIEIKINT